MQYLLMKPAFLLAVLATATTAPTWTQIIWHDIQAATSCTACETLLKSLQQASQLGPSTLQTILTDVCILSKILDADFCTGLIASQVPSAYYVLRQLSIPSDTAQTFCASVLDLCPYPPIPPINLTFPPPPLYFPITTTTTTQDNNKTNNITLRIAHITDTHVDLQYTPGTSTHCRKPICCRQYHANDAPGRSKTPCSTWGSPHCDPPLKLLHNMLSTLQSQQPHLTLFTGDIVAHDIWNTSQESVLASFNATNSALHTLLNNHPIYASIGNHDTHPVNFFPGSPNIPKELVDVEWTYTALTTHWRTLQNNPTLRTTTSGAYATTHTLLPPTSPTQEQTTQPSTPKIKIKIISYNSNLYYRLNLLLYTTPMPDDPLAQFTWLIAELHTAEQEGHKVLLITHIPISSKDTLPAYANSLREILYRYKDTVVGVFCGHGHVDTFGVFYSSSHSSGGGSSSNGSAGSDGDSDSDSHENQGHRQGKITVENNNNNNEVTVEKGEREEVIGVGMMAPAMTPTSGYSAFRVYDVQFSCGGGGWKVLDFEEYIARFPQHSLQGDSDEDSKSTTTTTTTNRGKGEPVWVRYYSAMEAYGKYVYPNWAGTVPNGIGAGGGADIGPHFWAKLTDVMETDWNV
ncbi:uncharacterized protein AKAW2_51136S [Aspergillus luchuensis]|uniref:Calcineurin-like phosphoesterase domain-containing protein n=1 Tax=Aspergillus kawachii TaxID=1069201 RepID=A0A7R7WDU1_ASPKA|nr:uncharacterized protein AKAW2_51136S [Aspergillus luchuensis]BCS00795.1 hypothetical protein AKAW2_51136S [Aspergillus luchuensis]